MTDAATPARQRIESVDVVRGVIMIIMALDHTRDFFGAAAVSPTNLATTTAALFLTRWITHFCAPVFFLTSGIGTWLGRRRRSSRELSWFLVTRGLWLAFLPLALFCFFLRFNVYSHITLLPRPWGPGWAVIP